MAPLVTLLVTYGIAQLALRKRPDRTLPARIALSVMLLVTGASHFASTGALAAMVPPVVPEPVLVVYATGVAELVLALLIVVRPSPALGWTLVTFFLALLPANVYSAVAEVGIGGHGASYLWFRVPLQLLFIAWAALCTRAVRLPRRSAPGQREDDRSGSHQPR